MRFLQYIWRRSKFLFSLLCVVTKTGKDPPHLQSSDVDQHFLQGFPLGDRIIPRQATGRNTTNKTWLGTLSWILYEFSNQLQERGVFHSRKIFLTSAKTVLQWIYTKTAKSDGMEGPSRNLLIGRKVSLKSFHTSTGVELVPTPTHWQARLWLASSPSFLPSAKEDESRKALEVLHDVREG